MKNWKGIVVYGPLHIEDLTTDSPSDSNHLVLEVLYITLGLPMNGPWSSPPKTYRNHHFHLKAWYMSPGLLDGTSYFKSMDGHRPASWDFVVRNVPEWTPQPGYLNQATTTRHVGQECMGFQPHPPQSSCGPDGSRWAWWAQSSLTDLTVSLSHVYHRQPFCLTSLWWLDDRCWWCGFGGLHGQQKAGCQVMRITQVRNGIGTLWEMGWSQAIWFSAKQIKKNHRICSWRFSGELLNTSWVGQTIQGTIKR